MHANACIDLQAYLERVGYGGDLRADHATLAALHLAHATHIPFENLDVLLRRPIRLDPGSLQSKLIAGGRGGYCFEHNLLFAAVLRALGFPVTTLAARVRYRTTLILPRTHMLLLVHADGRDWVADVGFGGEGLLLPVPFGSGEAVAQFAWTYRVIEQDGAWVMQSQRDDAWVDLYAFTLERQELADYEVANYYVSTHPSSRFVRTLTVQLPTPQVRNILRDRELIQERGSGIATRTISSNRELLSVLAQTFGLHLEADTQLLQRLA